MTSNLQNYSTYNYLQRQEEGSGHKEAGGIWRRDEQVRKKRTLRGKDKQEHCFELENFMAGSLTQSKSLFEIPNEWGNPP